MAKFSQYEPQGDHPRRLRSIEQGQRTDRTARRLEAASVGRGGIRITDGGAIVVEGPDGEIAAQLSAEELLLLGDLRAEGGGRFTYRDINGVRRVDIGDRLSGEAGQTRIAYFTPEELGGATAVIIGTQLSDGEVTQHGIIVFYNDDDTNILNVGERLAGGSPFILRYRNGVAALIMGDGERFSIEDAEGVAQVWVDEDGLRRPRQHVHWLTTIINGGKLTEADDDWTVVARGEAERTYPTIRIRWEFGRTGSPEVDVRFRDLFTDTVIIGPISHSSAAAGDEIGTLPGNKMSRRDIVMEARVTAGTGEARLGVRSARVGHFA